MFDWFKSREERAKEYDNIVKFPTPIEVPTMPEVKEIKQKDATIFYRFGVTDTNRVAFSMGHNEITMNKQGCQEMIEELTFFMDRLKDDVEEESNSNDASTAKD